MKNMNLAYQVIVQLIEQGVETFLICAGARNAPFVKLLGQSKNLDVQYFFDERAASFFALGKIKSNGKPVAVVTTSGTAVSETVSAAIEAYYSSLPVVFLTADRPRNYRGRGAPQSIEQVGIYSHYCETNYDLSVEDHSVPALKICKDGPTHINVCFDEPLIDSDVFEIDFNTIKRIDSVQIQGAHTREQRTANEELTNFLSANQKPLVLCGEIPFSQVENVFQFLKSLKAPIYAEGTSQLWKYADELPLLRGGAQTVDALLNEKMCDSVLRIGGVPTIRAWRDLEKKFVSLPVLSISNRPFTGLARESFGPYSYTELNCLRSENFIGSQNLSSILAIDEANHLRLSKAIAQNPKSEVSLLKAIANLIPNQADIFLGNSLPIREWDLIASTLSQKSEQRIYANRGVNGIDGLIATALGASVKNREMWAVIGDLSALYDLNSLAISSDLFPNNLRIVVLNNSGGQIFRRMFKDPNFINSHSFDFSHWAKMFNFDYFQVTNAENIKSLKQKSRVVVEVLPDLVESDHFWRIYEASHE